MFTYTIAHQSLNHEMRSGFAHNTFSWEQAQSVLPVFSMTSHPSPTSAHARLHFCEHPAFGQIYIDRMVAAKWTSERQWHEAAIGLRLSFFLDPACAALHYAPEIFEGMKAYRTPDGGAALFRPEENARRFAKSAERMACLRCQMRYSSGQLNCL
jgi:hypothetical protein